MRRPDRRSSPPQWRRRTSTTDRIEFERRIDADGREYLRLLARRTERGRPSAGSPGWAIDLERRSREVSTTRSVGHAATRSHAVRSLIGAMRTVNGVLNGDESEGEDDGHASLVERLRGRTDRRSARGDGRRHRPRDRG